MCAKKQNEKVIYTRKCTVEIKKWCRDNGIHDEFYKFISNFYSAILSLENNLPILPIILKDI